ncbi:MAG: zinc ABC transporter substrate-binding protein [Myxococcales bacterium]|nr:zinc ABC transporter substrate-binding protein [Myxococcales bacterium]
MSHSLRTAIVLLFLLVLSLPACSRNRDEESSNQQQLRSDAIGVVTTVGMLADMASELAGDCADVEALMGAGVDPHLYRASAGDLQTLGGADMILYGGLSLEGAMGEVLARMSERTTAYAALEAVEQEQLMQLHNSAGHYDPHLWNDVGMWLQVMPGVEQAMAERVPSCADQIHQNGDLLATRLVALDTWARESAETVPEAVRVLVTAHDAFEYFGRAYGFEVLGIQGVSTASEAGVADIQRVAGIIAERRIPALFVESSVNPRNIQAVREAVESRGWEVAIGGELFSDAMGQAGTWRGTYIGMIRHNVAQVVTALGGQPAPWPDELQYWADQWAIEGF